MEITERKKFDFLLINHCINRVNWNTNDSEDTLKQTFASCIHLVSRA